VRRLALWVVLGVAVVGAGVGAAGTPMELPKGVERFAALKPGRYQAGLFSPAAQLTIPDAQWNGAQWVKAGIHAIVLPRSLKVDVGGMLVLSAPASTVSAATVLQRLRSERAAGPDVGMTVKPTVALRVAGYAGEQFDGVVTGRYGHTFVPFSGKSGDASLSAGDHDRLPRDTAFRIVVLDVRGKVLFFEIDSGGKASIQNAKLLSDASKIIRSMTFTTS
jgi:hypothetical protein